MLDTEASQKEKLEEEIGVLRSQLLQMSMEADEVGVTAIAIFFAWTAIAALLACYSNITFMFSFFTSIWF